MTLAFLIFQTKFYQNPNDKESEKQNKIRQKLIKNSKNSPQKINENSKNARQINFIAIYQIITNNFYQLNETKNCRKNMNFHVQNFPFSFFVVET